MNKEILNDLLKLLLDKRLNDLEQKNADEIKDFKNINKYFSKNEELIKDIIIKVQEKKRKSLIRQKTSDNLKLNIHKRGSGLITASNRRRVTKSKDRIEKDINNNNFSNLNKDKIDGNYKVKKPNERINERKNYKTPIKLNQINKNRNKKETNNEQNINANINITNVNKNVRNKTPLSSFNSNNILSNRIKRKSKGDIMNNTMNNKLNKSYIMNNTNKSILNKSNNNISNLDNKKCKTNTSIKKTKKKININQKPKTNLFFKKFDINKNINESEKNSEINTDNKNMIDAHKNFGDWLGTEEGRFVLISLSNYLDSKSKYSLFSSKKSYIKFLYRHIEDKYTEFKENNKINPNSNSIQEKINEIKQSNDDTHKFNLSIGTLKALELLNNEEHLKFFTSEKYDSFSDDICLVYKIIFQLTPFNEIKNSENKKIFFENMIKYVENCAKNEEKNVGQIFKEIVKKFEFNKENILDVKNMILGNEDKLKPKFYSKICKTTGLIIFLIKDIFEYLGFNNNNNKCSPAVILANLEFLEKMKAKIPNYLKFLKQFT